MRKLISSYIKLLVILSVAYCTTSCFTGIESTPKISANTIRNNGVRITSEQELASLISSEPTAKWKQGKKWLVDDEKIVLTFSSASDSIDTISGKTISLEAIRSYPTLTGNNAIELVLKACENGQTFFHRTGIDSNDWPQKSSYDIPFTVELSVVSLADSILKDNIYYITNPRWFDNNNSEIIGQRHVPVKITKVLPGNHLYPIAIYFSEVLRPENPESHVMITYGNDVSATRNFDRIFSITDPRKRYPQISDQTWQKIINSQIAEGMTRDECRLALGTPYNIERATATSGQLERWSYENGVYLLFEDGILTKFRM